MNIALFLLLALPLPGMVQEVDRSEGCRVCHYTGVEVCGRHDQKLAAAEEKVLFCSVATACPDCAGGLVVDCTRCDGGPGQLKMKMRQARAQRFLASPAAPEKLFDRTLVRIVTPHFDIIIDSEKLKNGKRRMSAHEVAHFLAHEAEEAAAMLDAHLGAELHHYAHRTHIWFWSTKNDHHLVNQEIHGTNDSGAFKLFGAEPSYSCWAGELGLTNDALLVVSNGVHISIHLLLSSVFNGKWIGNKKAGWFDVGSAHWYEDAVFQQITTYCIDEADAILDYENGRWRVAIRRYLAKHKKSLLPALLQKISGTLWDDEHALSWSLYDWVVANHPEAIKPLLLGYKERKETRNLFREHLGMTIPQVEVAWRAWVADTYPMKDPKPRKKL